MIEEQDEVTFHYTGQLGDGTVFDSSEDEPMTAEVGTNFLIPGLEDALLGMEEGDEKTVTVQPEDAYGERRDDMIVDVDRDNIPDDLDVMEDATLNLRLDSGQTVPVVVKEIGEDTVTVDANHPLAGYELTFDLEVVDVA